jgi:hypothetical protein
MEENFRMRESFRSDYGLIQKKRVDENPDTLGNMSFGTGAIGDIRHDIGHSIRHGFGRNTGSFYPRSVRRRFNREFQRGHHNQVKCGRSVYAHECGLPASYYPSSYNCWMPYSFHFDPYPYHELDDEDLCRLRPENRPRVVVQARAQAEEPRSNLPLLTLLALLALLVIVSTSTVALL